MLFLLLLLQSQLPQLLPSAAAGAEGGYGGVFIGDVRLSGLCGRSGYMEAALLLAG